MWYESHQEVGTADVLTCLLFYPQINDCVSVCLNQEPEQTQRLRQQSARPHRRQSNVHVSVLLSASTSSWPIEIIFYCRLVLTDVPDHSDWFDTFTQRMCWWSAVSEGRMYPGCCFHSSLCQLINKLSFITNCCLGSRYSSMERRPGVDH